MTESGRETVGCVLLAAGVSSRFEPGNKLLAPISGTPIVRHVAETVCTARVDDVVVILGHKADAISETLTTVSLSVRYNDNYREGQSTSVGQGVEFARKADWDAAIFMLGDMPFVQSETVDHIVRAYRSGEGSIIVPRYKQQRGNPVLFDSQYFDILADLSGDIGGRNLIAESDGTQFIETNDPGINQDIDTRVDLDEYTDSPNNMSR